MSNNYNFDEIQDESPEIIMGGLKYRLRYPTVEDIEKVQELKTDQERTDAIYDFIETTEEGQKPFKETLKKQSIKVMIAFTEMVKKEFGVE